MVTAHPKGLLAGVSRRFDFGGITRPAGAAFSKQSIQRELPRAEREQHKGKRPKRKCIVIDQGTEVVPTLGASKDIGDLGSAGGPERNAEIEKHDQRRHAREQSREQEQAANEFRHSGDVHVELRHWHAPLDEVAVCEVDVMKMVIPRDVQPPAPKESDDQKGG